MKSVDTIRALACTASLNVLKCDTGMLNCSDSDPGERFRGRQTEGGSPLDKRCSVAVESPFALTLTLPRGEGTVTAGSMFSAHWFGKLRRGYGRKMADDSPSPQGRGPGSTAIELSELRQDRNADFSPLPAVLGGPESGGLKSALLNSMAVLPFPLPALLKQYWCIKRGERDEGACSILCNVRVDLEGKVGEASTGAAPMNRGCAPQASPIPIDPPPGLARGYNHRQKRRPESRLGRPDDKEHGPASSCRGIRPPGKPASL